MNKLTIEHYPNTSITLFNCSPSLKIDLCESMKAELKKDEKLTRTSALRILKEVKFESDVRYWCSKPYVLLPTAMALLVLGFFIPAAHIALVVLRLFFAVVGFVLSAVALGSLYQGNLFRISEVYLQQSKKAEEYIKKLQAADQTIQVEWADTSSAISNPS